MGSLYIVIFSMQSIFLTHSCRFYVQCTCHMYLYSPSVSVFQFVLRLCAVLVHLQAKGSIRRAGTPVGGKRFSVF